MVARASLPGPSEPDVHQQIRQNEKGKAKSTLTKLCHKVEAVQALGLLQRRKLEILN